jgi:hypothetical protein
MLISYPAVDQGSSSYYAAACGDSGKAAPMPGIDQARHSFPRNWCAENLSSLRETPFVS